MEVGVKYRQSFRISLICVLLSPPLWGQGTVRGVPASLNGEWVLTTQILGVPMSERLALQVEGAKLAGSLNRWGNDHAIEGTWNGQEMRFEVKGKGGPRSTYTGTLAEGVLSGRATLEGDRPEDTIHTTWRAQRIPARPPGPPRTYDFEPKEFHRTLSSTTSAVLHIWPGDTVRTTSVDAGGQDEKSAKRVIGGNPLTGPFYIEGAMPGDVLAVTIKHLRTNRDWAASDYGLVDRALTSSFRAEAKDFSWKEARWRLDAARGVATLEKPSEHLKNFVVPLRPMLGCVGVAPGFGDAPLSTRDSGDVGGNMDFNQVREGTTVYLQVNQPGALLYLGDGHALQGDGELNGNALETSLDIEFRVDVQRAKRMGTPRAENSEYLMALGLAGSLDAAFREATSELVSWLESDYGLTVSDAAAVLGTSIEYNIAEVADRNVGVVAKIRKESLGPMRSKTSSPRSRPQ